MIQNLKIEGGAVHGLVRKSELANDASPSMLGLGEDLKRGELIGFT